MRSFAECISKELDIKGDLDIARTDRYSFFKIGPVLSISVSVLFVKILVPMLFKHLGYMLSLTITGAGVYYHV